MAPEAAATIPDGPAAAPAEAPAPDAWMIVPVLADGDVLDETMAVARGLFRDANVPVVGDADSSLSVESRHSVDPTPIGANDIERWASRSGEALHHLSRGDYDAARLALLEAQAISERAAEALSRESMRARQVLDTCLFVVRASIETGAHAAAEEQAKRCRRLVPRIQASAYTHTPEVRELVARVDREFANESAGELEVDTNHAGCIVRVNGVHFGAAPMRTSELVQGQYRIQVECDETIAGRIHTVSLGTDDTELHVDAIFDQALRARPIVSLTYPTRAHAEAHARGHGVTLAHALGRRIVLVERIDDTIHVLAIDARGRAARPEVLDAGAGADATARASRLAAYLAPESNDSLSEPTSDTSHPRRPLAYSLLATGVVGLGTSVGLLTARTSRGRDLEALDSMSASYLVEQSRFLRLRVALDTIASVGSLAGAVGASMALRSAKHRNAVAWSSAAIGLGLVGWSVFEVMQAPVCYGVPICIEADRRIDRATVVGAFAFPALTMPIVALVPPNEADDAPPIVARLDLRSTYAGLSVGGFLR